MDFASDLSMVLRISRIWSNIEGGFGAIDNIFCYLSEKWKKNIDFKNRFIQWIFQLQIFTPCNEFLTNYDQDKSKKYLKNSLLFYLSLAK